MKGSHLQPGGTRDSPSVPPGPPPGKVDEQLARNLLAHRNRLGWSQADVAKAMGALGWTSFYPQTVARIESRQRKVSVGEGDALARVFGTTLDRLQWAQGEDAEVMMAEGAITRIRQAWREASTAAAGLAHALWAGERAVTEARRSKFDRVHRTADALEDEIAGASVESAFEDGLDRWERRDEREGGHEG